MENTAQNNSKELTNDGFKQKFEQTLLEYDKTQQGSKRKPWSQQRILEVIRHVKKANGTIKTGERLEPMDYYCRNKFDVITTANEDRLVFKRKQPEEPTVYIIPKEQYFEKLSEVHQSCGHSGRDKMVQIMKNRFYIPKKAIEIFISLCPTCEMNKNTNNKSKVTNLALRDYNARGQFDIIDMQSCADGKYKWLLSYQDNATKYTNLRPLKTKNTSEIAMELVKIFLTFGPYTLQSEIGRELTTKVIQEISSIWPACKVKQGFIKGPGKDQARIECQAIENLLHSWIHDNNSTQWSLGCLFVQYQKNTSMHSLIGKSPHHSLFGCEPNVTLSNNHNTPCVLLSVKSEQLNNVSLPNSSHEVPIKFDSSSSSSVLKIESSNALKTESNNFPTKNLDDNTNLILNIKTETRDPLEYGEADTQFDKNVAHQEIKLEGESTIDNTVEFETKNIKMEFVEFKMEFTEE